MSDSVMRIGRWECSCSISLSEPLEQLSHGVELKNFLRCPCFGPANLEQLGRKFRTHLIGAPINRRPIQLTLNLAINVILAKLHFHGVGSEGHLE